MKGLLYKDFKSILKLISPVYLMSLIPIIVYIGKDMFLFMFSIIIGILFGMQVSITISVDEKTKLVNYYRILPLSYHVIAMEKYIFTLIISLLTGIIIFLVTFSYSGQLSLLYPFIGFYVALIYNMIVIPASFYFGVEKGRYILIGFTILPIIITKFNIVLLKLYSILQTNLIALAVILHLIIFVISYVISVKSIENYRI